MTYDPTRCPCRCDTCLDSDCDGNVCRPHAAGRWVVVSPFMAHPLPTDFPSREAAEEFLAPLADFRLTTMQVDPAIGHNA
jgi:hypothetical protein